MFALPNAYNFKQLYGGMKGHFQHIIQQFCYQYVWTVSCRNVCWHIYDI
jgi:hypothetical protein